MSALMYLHQQAIPTALSMLPEKMYSAPAEAMMLTIILQESRALYRRQIGGPARGFAQFEVTGVKGVMKHHLTKGFAENILERMHYPFDPVVVHTALEHNDVLAAVFARLLLWTHPAPLPLQGEADKSWEYYLSLWRPGKPHKDTWAEFYQQGWAIAKGGMNGRSI